MVTKIATGKNIQGILNYNENKVKEGTASLLIAQGFGATTDKLSFHEKLTRFEKLIEKNKRAKTNALHFSLNFESSEKLIIIRVYNILIILSESRFSIKLLK